MRTACPSGLTRPPLSVSSLRPLHANFLLILPRIETHAQFFFRHVKCPGKKADAIGETIALAWKWFVRLHEKGKDANEFVSILATYAVRHVRTGRKLCGQEKSKDVLSPLAQTRRCFTVSKLADLSTLTGNSLDEALHDNTRSPVPDQVAFRCDFPAWLVELGDHKRRIAQDMAMGHSTQEVANMHHVTQGRISQMRRELHTDWRRFCGEEIAPRRNA